jgi:hypothetical protein
VTAPTAGGITVHRCVVRVVRRGGWSWGPDPHDLVRQAVNALPDLLAERFAEHLDGDGPDVEITEPVSLTIRLRSPGPLANLVIEPTPSTYVVPHVEPATSNGKSTVDDTRARPVPPDRPVTPTTLFTELAERGELEPLLALLPDESLRTYLIASLLATRAPWDSDPVVAALVAEFAGRFALDPPPAHDDLLRLVQSLADPQPATDAPEPDTSTAPTRPPPVEVQEAAGETQVCSVLPFLLAGPLARIGYLDAIGPALAGAGLLAQAPLFAAALAYKVLAAHAAAAAFAGLESVPELGAFAARVRQALPVLDGVLALSLCRGHDPADPLLLTGTDGGLLLVDTLGMFPIAWAREVAGLLPHWEACGRPDIAVCDSPLPPACLRDLATAGVQLVTSIRPLRGDPLTRLPRAAPLWTAGRPSARLAADLPAHTEHVNELVRTLMVTHRAVPRAEDRALDRSAMLAASLGLGLIAWTLWRERETTTPVLTMTRFADLEATVRFTPDAVRVRIPLGRRHADLLRHGALTDVHDVVWLGGRTLTFSGG